MPSFSDQTPGQPPVRGFLHTPALTGDAPTGDALVLTHGAGADCNARLLIALAEEFCRRGLTVLRADLPFRQLRPHGPPLRTAADDQRGLRRALNLLAEQHPKPARLFLGGHSYGGRMASMLAAAESVAVTSSAPRVANLVANSAASPERPAIAALLLLSYPLHPPKRPDQLRTAHFPQLRTPSLFVSGARDGFASSAELASALQLIPAPTELLTIPGAGHELLTKSNAATLPALIAEAFLRFATHWSPTVSPFPCPSASSAL